MRIAIGSDHAGFLLKSQLKTWLLEHGYEVTDVGTDSTDSVDYPKYGFLVGKAVSSGAADFGVAVCGSGQGICMAVNKVHGVRGAVVRDLEDATIVRHHNDANVICFGERFTTPEIATDALQAFLTAPFDGGRHERRVNLLGDIDDGQSFASE